MSFEQLETRALLTAVSAAQLLDDFTITGNVGEKPESKIWQHAGNWWGVFSDTIGTHVWRLDGQKWNKTFQISEAKGIHVDAKANGNVTHVLFRNNLNTQLYSLQYIAGPVPNYSLWNDRPTPADIQLATGVEAATIDLDSKGRMWVAYDDKTSIKVRYSDSPYRTWSDPIALANGVKGDDIAALTAMPNGTVGVFWSNHTTRRFGFRTHVDGTDPTAWTTDEVPASQSSLDVDTGFTNDHINLAVASDATLYAAIKTGYSAVGLPEIGILVRRPNAEWKFHALDARNATRPIIQLNETANILIVSYNRGSSWVYQECDATTISCSDAKMLLSAGENGTSTKQNVTSDLVILTSGKATSSTVSGAKLTFGSNNSAPTVDAGRDQTTVSVQSVNLQGVVRDDGRPTPPASLTTNWSKLTGPGVVTFSNAASLQTSASFSQPGSYVLELSANDAELIGKDTITVTVNKPPVASVTKSFQDGVFPTAAYSGTRDTKLRASNPTTNYGRETRLEVFQSPIFASLFRWEVSEIPASATVLGASLTLNAATTAKNSYEIYELLGNWVESEATFLQASKNVLWKTAGARGADTDRGSTLLGTIKSPKKGFVTAELNAGGVAVIQKWISNPASNHGFVLQDISDPLLRNWVITSRESFSSLTRPKLSITFASTNTSPTVSSPRSSPLRNADNPLDVNGDGQVTPMDALIIVNAVSSGTAEHAEGSERPTFFPDASGDGSITPLDALLVINYLNGDGIEVGEGEANTEAILTADAVLAVRRQNENFANAQSSLSNTIRSVTNGPSLLSLQESHNPLRPHLHCVDLASCDEVLKSDPESTLDAVCDELLNPAVTALTYGEFLGEILGEVGK